MRTLFTSTTAVLSFLLATSHSAELEPSEPLTSRVILPSTFRPPPVFQNVNLLRTIDLEKSYPRETINVVIENIDTAPQDEYFLPFDGETIGKVGGLEVKDKKVPENGPLDVELVEYDPEG